MLDRKQIKHFYSSYRFINDVKSGIDWILNPIISIILFYFNIENKIKIKANQKAFPKMICLRYSIPEIYGLCSGFPEG